MSLDAGWLTSSPCMCHASVLLPLHLEYAWTPVLRRACIAKQCRQKGRLSRKCFFLLVGSQGDKTFPPQACCMQTERFSWRRPNCRQIQNDKWKFLFWNEVYILYFPPGIYSHGSGPYPSRCGSQQSYNMLNGNTWTLFCFPDTPWKPSVTSRRPWK